MGQMIGIDLGTTNTAICAMVDGRPQMIKNQKGYTVFPSAVYINASGETSVGRKAKTSMMTEPERGVFAVKRLLGRRFDSDEVSQLRKQVPYQISAAPNGSCIVHMAGEQYSPIDIASFILKEAKIIAEETLGDEVDQAVITVPAYYNHAQRAATKKAAEKAGLHCERIINEPTSAALAYGERTEGERHVLIFDLGGGTFDISILHFSNGLVETLATRGDTFLGGEDFDERLLDMLADNFLNAHNIDPREDPVARRRLKDAAEGAKCELSFRDSTTILVPRLLGNTTLEYEISRGEFELLVDDLIQRAIEVTSQTITDSGLRFQDIDDLVLVGGQTRMPLIKQRVGTVLQLEPVYGVNPEEIVATGACVHGNSLVTESTDSPILLDVTPFDLGIDIRGGFFERIIPRNTHVPTMETKSFSTGRIGQESVRIVVRQGESKYAADNEFLGEFIMNNLVPDNTGAAKVEVTLRLDANGMLHVTATDPATGERHNITARNYGDFVRDDSDISLDIQGDEVKPPKANEVLKGNISADQMLPAGNEGIKKKSGLLSKLFGSSKGELPAPSETQDSDAQATAKEPTNVSLSELELDASAFSEIDDLTLDSIDDLDGDLLSELKKPESKTAIVGMGDSSSSSQHSKSTETRSDIQFEQDDTLLIDVFNEDAQIESLLYDGVEDPPDESESIPESVQRVTRDEDDIDSILSSILDEPDDDPTLIMKRMSPSGDLDDEISSLLTDIKDDSKSDSDDLDVLLKELESEVEANSSSSGLLSDTPTASKVSVISTIESGDDIDIDLDSFLAEFDIEVDVEEPEMPGNDAFASENIDAPPVTASDAVASDEEIDIDDFLSTLDIDFESIDETPEASEAPEPSPTENTPSFIKLDTDDEIDLDVFLAEIESLQEAQNDSSLLETSTAPSADIEEADLEIQVEADLALGDMDNSQETIDIEPYLELKKNELDGQAAESMDDVRGFDSNSKSSATEQSAEDDSASSNLQPLDPIAEVIKGTDTSDVFELPDDGFFNIYDSNKGNESNKALDVATAKSEEDEPLEIPNPNEESQESELDFLDDLFDD